MAEREDDQQAEAPAAPQSAAPESGMAAVAVALARKHGSRPDEALDAFLDKQAALADAQRQLASLQMEHLHEERELHHKHSSLRYLADRLRIGLQLVAIAFGLFIVIGLGVMAWQAHEDHSLVIESFSVPPDLAARGASGQALAEDLMGRVAAIRSAANGSSLTHTDDVRADRSDGLKVEIPETGVSVGEIERFLHRWLGHQTVLTGEVRDEPNGEISIGLHIAGADPIEVKGPAADLDRLMQQTAEKAFQSFDPGNYIIYLRSLGRGPEAFAAAERLAMDPGLFGQSTDNRADYYSLWANADPDRRRALAHALIAIDFNPLPMVAWMEAGSASGDLGHDQAAVDFYRKMMDRKMADQLPSQRRGLRSVIENDRRVVDEATGDFGALAHYQDRSSSVVDRYASSARAAALLHDVAQSRVQLAHALTAGPADGVLWRARWQVSASAGDWPQALIDAKVLVDDAEKRKAAAPGPEWAAQVELELQTVHRPGLAWAEAMTGDVAGAQALIASSPLDCYLCTRVRGRIAAAAGDTAGADRWFAEAVRQAPDLPMAYLEWAQMLLARGDLAGAAAKFTLAHKTGPRFADPLKGLGDVLARQGQWKAATASYDEALKDASAWTELRQARAAAAARAG